MINLNRELVKILDKDKEYNNVLYRHYSSIKCQCMMQNTLIYDDIAKANVANPSYRTVADPECPNCEGSGWVFEEFLFRCIYFYPGFRYAHYEDIQMAMTAENMLTMYLKVDENWQKIKPNDTFYNIRADKYGKVELPIVRYRKWVVTDAFDMRLDSNKIEFMKIFAKPAII